MKKYILYSCTLLINSFAFSQVGIGTTNPQGVFHVDAGKNTIVGGTSSNFSDDLTITATGNVGIGTLSPSTKLELNSTTAGAIKIVDGTEGVGKVLVSDAAGVGTWQTLPVFKYAVNGSFSPAATIISDNTATQNKFTNGFIVLNKGRWLVNIGLSIRLNSVDANTNVNPYWLQLYLSDTTSGITNTQFSYVSNSANNFGGNMIRSYSQNFNFISGFNIIDVPNDNTTIYILIQNVQQDSYGKDINWNFSTSNYENYIYAIPTN